MYNQTLMNSTETLFDMVSVISTESNGAFSYLSLLLFWIAMFVAFKNFETRVGLLASSMITTLLAVFFWWAGWISFAIIFIPAVLTFVALIWNALGE